MKPANHGIKHRLTSRFGLPIAEGYPLLDPNFPNPARYLVRTDTRALLITNATFVIASDTLTLLY